MLQAPGAESPIAPPRSVRRPARLENLARPSGGSIPVDGGQALWATVETVLGAEEAKKFRQETHDELHDPKFVGRVIQAMCMSIGSEPVQQKEASCLFVIGPAAAGKSYVLDRGIIDCPPDAIKLDGQRIREVSASWERSVKIAQEHHLAGLSNFFDEYFKPGMDAVKALVFDKSLQSNANLVIPDTASNPKKLKAMIDKVAEKGYMVSLGVVLADRIRCGAQGASRAYKKYAPKHFDTSLAAIMDIYTHMEQKGFFVKGHGPRFISNMRVPHFLALDQAKEFLKAEAETKPTSLKGKYCEVGLLAGVYKAFKEEGLPLRSRCRTSSDFNSRLSGGTLSPGLRVSPRRSVERLTYEIIPAIDSQTEEVSTRMNIVGRGGVLVEVLQLSFAVSTCRLHGAENDWLLGIEPNGKPVLQQNNGQRLVWEDELPGYSLAHRVADDAKLLQALQGADFCRNRFRDVSEQEFQHVMEVIGMAGPKEAPSRAQPRGVILLAPSACGKSTALKSLPEAFFNIKRDEAVSIESGEYRDEFPPYKALIDNGLANDGIWFRGWPVAKEAMSKLKKKLLDVAIQKRKDVMISDTGSETEKLMNTISKLKGDGYIVNVCGIFAHPREIMERGIAREVMDGKRYNRDMSRVEKGFRVFPMAIRAINGKFCLMRNSNQKGAPAPQIYLQGDGGSVITFSLAEALASPGQRHSSRSPAPSPRGGLSPRGASATCLPELEVSHEDVYYMAEGNSNILLGYRGNAPDLQGCSLRMRKGRNCDVRGNVQFIQQVSRRVFGPEFVDCGTLVGFTPWNVVALDRAILNDRPVQRQHKRLDSQVRDSSGRILAMKMTNFLACKAAAEHPMITVELKPKVGMLERRGLPGKFAMLQHYKLQQGKVARISAYDPIKLLSSDPKLIREALEAAMDEPQNVLRVFINNNIVLSEELSAEARAAMDQQLIAAGLPGREGLLVLLTALLSSPTFPLVERIKRAQAWSAGEAPLLANALYIWLCSHHGADAEAILARCDNYRSALETVDVESMGCDEAASLEVCKNLDDLVGRAASETWSPDLEREVIGCLCRFLLGRLASDVSILINFIPLPQAARDLKVRLGPCGFKPLDLERLPAGARLDTPGFEGFWWRATVVDLDNKPAGKIQEYAQQLDLWAEAYCGRAVGGVKAPKRLSSDDLKEEICQDLTEVEGEIYWKRDKGGERGRAELDFYRWALDDEEAKRIVPALLGYRTAEDGRRYVGLASLLEGFSEPLALDLQVGMRNCSADGKLEEEEAQGSAAAPLGVRVISGRLRDQAEIPFRVGARHQRPVKDQPELVELMRSFLSTEGLRRSALAKLESMLNWWKDQEKYAFYGSSILLSYDWHKNTECRVCMADFCALQPISKKTEDLSGFDIGLAALIQTIEALPATDTAA